jgi:hypothetical protein
LGFCFGSAYLLRPRRVRVLVDAREIHQSLLGRLNLGPCLGLPELKLVLRRRSVTRRARDNSGFEVRLVANGAMPRSLPRGASLPVEPNNVIVVMTPSGERRIEVLSGRPLGSRPAESYFSGLETPAGESGASWRFAVRNDVL